MEECKVHKVWMIILTFGISILFTGCHIHSRPAPRKSIASVPKQIRQEQPESVPSRDQASKALKEAPQEARKEKSVLPKPKVGRLEQHVVGSSNSLDISALEVGSYKTPSQQLSFVTYLKRVHFDYVSYRVCSDNNETKCLEGKTALQAFLLPKLAVGKYKLYMKACGRSSSDQSALCGAWSERYFDQKVNARTSGDDPTNTYLSLTQEVEQMATEVERKLKRYKKSLKQMSLASPDDDLERAIDNVLTLGAYKHALYYLSPGLIALQQSYLESAPIPAAASRDALPTVAPGSLQDRAESKATGTYPLKSTWGTIMLIGGFAGAGSKALVRPSQELPPSYILQHLESRLAAAQQEGYSAQRIAELELLKSESSRRLKDERLEPPREERLTQTAENPLLSLVSLSAVAARLALPLADEDKVAPLRRRLLQDLAKAEDGLLELRRKIEIIEGQLQRGAS